MEKYSFRCSNLKIQSISKDSLGSKDSNQKRNITLTKKSTTMGRRKNKCRFCHSETCLHCQCKGGYSRCTHDKNEMCHRKRYRRRLVCNSCERNKLIHEREIQAAISQNCKSTTEKNNTRKRKSQVQVLTSLSFLPFNKIIYFLKFLFLIISCTAVKCLWFNFSISKFSIQMYKCGI